MLTLTMQVKCRYDETSCHGRLAQLESLQAIPSPLSYDGHGSRPRDCRLNGKRDVVWASHSWSRQIGRVINEAV